MKKPFSSTNNFVLGGLWGIHVQDLFSEDPCSLFNEGIPRNDQTLPQEVSGLHAVSEVQKATCGTGAKEERSQNVLDGFISYKKLILTQENWGKTTLAHSMQAYEEEENGLK